MKNFRGRRIISVFVFSLLITKLFGQIIISSVPQYPTINDSAYITFHVDQCGCTLIGYTGDMYVHTGVKTTADNTWHHVLTNWGVNTPATKLVKLNNTTYVLHITPKIKNYYSLVATDTVTQMAFVFRSADASKQSSDLFYDVYQPGLTVRINHPANDTIYRLSDTVKIAVGAIMLGTPDPDSISLYIDDTLKYISHNTSFTYSFLSQIAGKHNVKVIADNGAYTSVDSMFFFSRQEITIAPLPAGVKDGINYIDTSSVTLVLFAPHKDNVFVIGDFNNWDLSESYLMNRTADSSRYWITLTNLQKGTEYAFQYLVDGSIHIADPYTDKILDPNNDHSISPVIYPGLKPYPVGKTTEIVSVFQTNQSEYPWEVASFTPPKTTDLVIYEMLVRDFTNAQSFKMAMDSIGYLKKLGVNAIELMPVNEFEGNSSWGYNPDFYFAVDKAYGTKNDYKKFIDECHKQGIAVIMDIVLNHSYGSSPLVRLYYNSTTGQVTAQNPWYNVTCPHPPYCWGYDFNHESSATKAFVYRVTKYWLEEYKIDGYRFDFTKGFTNKVNTPGNEGWAYDASRIAILEAMDDSIKAYNDKAVVIFEHFTDNSEEKVLTDHGILIWGNMNYSYNQNTMGYASGSDISPISYKVLTWNNPSLVGYMESHDEERLMYKNVVYGSASGTYNVKDTVTALHRMETAVSMFLTVPGPKMIYEFGELGYDFSINYDPVSQTINSNNRLAPKPVRWNYYFNADRKHLYDVYSALAHLRVDKSVFETPDFNITASTLVKRLHLNSSGMNVTVIASFDIVNNSINPVFQHTGTWYDYFTGSSYEVTDVNALISLAPGEYHILTDSLLPTPDITPLYPVINPVSVGEISAISGETRIFPNPTNGNVTLLPSTEGTLYFELYDMTGKKIYSNTLEVRANQSYSLNLNERKLIGQNGMYIYKIILNNTVSEGKLVLQ